MAALVVRLRISALDLQCLNPDPPPVSMDGVAYVGNANGNLFAFAPYGDAAP